MPIQPAVTPARLLQFSWGFAVPLMVEAAIRHRLFDVLERGPRTAAALAAETATSERGVRALLNALTSIELLSKDGEGRYSLTAESALFLVSTKPSFVGGAFEHATAQLIPRWLALGEVVRTGQAARHLDSDASSGARFHDFVEHIFPNSYPGAGAGRRPGFRGGGRAAARARCRGWLRRLGHRAGATFAARAGHRGRLAAGA